jgi:hypothetical protein
MYRGQKSASDRNTAKGISMSNKQNIELWDVTTIKPYPLNAKIHNEAQVEKIAKSIKDFGWRGNPIVVDKDGVILAGHGRRLAALKLGLLKVPVVVEKDMTEEEARAYRLADNRVAISDIDTGILEKELASLDYDLAGIFDKKELDFIVANLSEVDHSAFVDDIDEEVKKQSDETSKKMEEVDAREVKIEKVMGFKSFKGKDERVIARFMAQIEAESGLPPAEAFVSFVKSLTGA